MKPSRASDTQFPEAHNIFCKSTGLVTENVADLTQFFVDSRSSRFERCVCHLIIHIHIVEQNHLTDLDDFHADIQRQWNHGIEHDYEAGDDVSGRNITFACQIPSCGLSIAMPDFISDGASQRQYDDENNNAEDDFVDNRLKRRCLD